VNKLVLVVGAVVIIGCADVSEKAPVDSSQTMLDSQSQEPSFTPNDEQIVWGTCSERAPAEAPRTATLAAVEDAPPKTAFLCSAEDEATEEAVGVAQEAQISLVARVTCELAAALIAHHICNNAQFWPAYCPSGAKRRVYDVWETKKYVDVSCDTLQELVCGSGAFAADRFAKLVFCGRVF
jgi:hypothetical protein